MPQAAQSPVPAPARHRPAPISPGLQHQVVARQTNGPARLSHGGDHLYIENEFMAHSGLYPLRDRSQSTRLFAQGLMHAAGGVNITALSPDGRFMVRAGGTAAAQAGELAWNRLAVGAAMAPMALEWHGLDAPRASVQSLGERPYAIFPPPLRFSADSQLCWIGASEDEDEDDELGDTLHRPSLFAWDAALGRARPLEQPDVLLRAIGLTSASSTQGLRIAALLHGPPEVAVARHDGQRVHLLGRAPLPEGCAHVALDARAEHLVCYGPRRADVFALGAAPAAPALRLMGHVMFGDAFAPADHEDLHEQPAVNTSGLPHWLYRKGRGERDAPVYAFRVRAHLGQPSPAVALGTWARPTQAGRPIPFAGAEAAAVVTRPPAGHTGLSAQAVTLWRSPARDGAAEPMGPLLRPPRCLRFDLGAGGQHMLVQVGRTSLALHRAGVARAVPFCLPEPNRKVLALALSPRQGELATLDAPVSAQAGERGTVVLRLWRRRGAAVAPVSTYSFPLDGGGGSDMQFAPSGRALFVWAHAPGDDLVVVELERSNDVHTV